MIEPRRHLLYVIGVPGSGKTTLVRRIVQGRRRRVVKQPIAHTVYEGGLVQLGRDRETHGGTDALSMSVQPTAVAMLETASWDRVIGEGDRLANLKFFKAAQAAGYKVDVVLLTCTPGVAAERRDHRGTAQDLTWLKGRRSKVENLAQAVTLDPTLTLIELDGRMLPDDLAAALQDHPVCRPMQVAS